MIIKSITLCNLGPFIGENKIDTHYTDDKYITLIGGKNGAGKTTLFNSIKIVLYGCKAYGYEVLCQQYYENIKRLINDKELAKECFKAFIEINLSFEDGKHDGEYILKRGWENKTDGFSEYKEIYCDGKLLSFDEINDFENLILHFVPPSLFDFYFFDGEKISSLLLDSGDSTNFKDAFIKMCGLDNLAILVNCFEKNSNKTEKNELIRSKYFDSLTELNKSDLVLKRIDEEITNLKSDIDEIGLEIKKITKDYQKHGGVSSKEWSLLQDKVLKEEIKREEARKELKEFANNDLPFLILKDELKKLTKNLNSYRLNSTVNNALSLFTQEKAWEYLSDNFSSPITKDEFEKNIITIFDSEKCCDSYPLSQNELFKVFAQIEAKLKINKTYYENLEETIIESQKYVKLLRDNLAGISVDDYQQYKKATDSLTKKVDKLNEKLKEKYLVYGSEKQKNEFLRKEFDKNKKAFEQDIKSRSSHDLSSRGYLAFSELVTNIYNEKINILKNKFIEIFNKIINKKNLVDGIYVNNQLSVYPYRFIEMKKTDCKRILSQKGEEYFAKTYGEYALEIAKKSRSEVLKLPVKIKGTLSEGENQVYLMSLYYSLTNLSLIKVPFIIDTPFGRIDTEHRKNILNNFFKKLGSQLIILSTDEEINSSNIKVIEDEIGSKNLFVNNGNGKTNILDDQYFGD